MTADEIAKDEEKYFDMLYNFAQVAVKANDMALDGYTPKQIAKKLKKASDAFVLLAKLDEVKKTKSKKKAGSEDPEEKPAQVVSEQPVEPEPLPDNFARDEKGWLLCPVCRKKLLKLTSTTKIVNCPVFCKACKAEYVLSWWNVENKDIVYTRYVNNRHYIDRADIRSKGMQGTGVQSFLNTGTSATERVAMALSKR